MAQIEGRKILWGDIDMMAAGGPENRTYIGLAYKMQGVQQGWMWRKKIDRCRRALEDENYNGN